MYQANLFPVLSKKRRGKLSYPESGRKGERFFTANLAALMFSVT